MTRRRRKAGASEPWRLENGEVNGAYSIPSTHFFFFILCICVFAGTCTPLCVSICWQLAFDFSSKAAFFVVDVVCRLVALLVCLSFSLHTYIEVYICSFVVAVVVAALSCSFEIITYLLVFFYRLSRKKFPNKMRISFFFFLLPFHYWTSRCRIFSSEAVAV